ncbi:hypothetical protein DOTSEDRAFT_28391 [Dothistroma septosporum NZE10]|uniref:Uncharacterized protein n=1 Tax=Dothistroma septosporum (strain NZE10 / CBS 128990) TaxID=675120 RepID=M2Y1N5_DOTSN|nr:hypothetical protein DOTSEDRAFT_28391 [Dothistroma septosporum NZE10]
MVKPTNDYTTNATMHTSLLIASDTAKQQHAHDPKLLPRDDQKTLLAADQKDLSPRRQAPALEDALALRFYRAEIPFASEDFKHDAEHSFAYTVPSRQRSGGALGNGQGEGDGYGT